MRGGASPPWGPRGPARRQQVHLAQAPPEALLRSPALPGARGLAALQEQGGDPGPAPLGEAAGLGVEAWGRGSKQSTTRRTAWDTELEIPSGGHEGRVLPTGPQRFTIKTLPLAGGSGWYLFLRYYD